MNNLSAKKIELVAYDVLTDISTIAFVGPMGAIKKIMISSLIFENLVSDDWDFEKNGQMSQLQMELLTACESYIKGDKVKWFKDQINNISMV